MCHQKIKFNSKYLGPGRECEYLFCCDEVTHRKCFEIPDGPEEYIACPKCTFFLWHGENPSIVYSSPKQETECGKYGYTRSKYHDISPAVGDAPLGSRFAHYIKAQTPWINENTWRPDISPEMKGLLIYYHSNHDLDHPLGAAMQKFQQMATNHFLHTLLHMTVVPSRYPSGRNALHYLQAISQCLDIGITNYYIPPLLKEKLLSAH